MAIPKLKIGNPTDQPPWFYGGPDLDDKSPHPDVTERATESHAAREVLLDGVDGPRAWGYGHHRTAGKLQYVFKEPRTMPNDVWLVIELAKGEADALIKGTRDGVDLTTLPGIAFWWYPGTPAGNVDANLAAVMLTAGLTWNEAFPGTEYVVVHLWDLDKYWPQRPNLLWERRLGKPLDPRTDTRAYSTNPFVQAWDFCLDPEGKHMPEARLIKQWFIDAANIADEMVGSPAHKRYETHPLLMDGVDTDDVIKMFRLMTDSFWFPDAGRFGFLCDRPGSPVASYGDSALSRSIQPQFSRENQQERPTKVIAEFTDVANDWKPKPVEVVVPGTPAGAEDDAPVTYKMLWIHDEGIAKSRAHYIAGGFAYDARVRVAWNATTEDRKLGEIVTQALNARGLSFTGRLISRGKPTRKSVYPVILHEYNSNRYLDFSISATVKTPSTLPSPSDVPPDVDLSTVTITELPYSEQPGALKTYGKIEITNPSFYFLDAVELWFAKSGGEYRFYDVFPAGSNNVVKLHFDAIAELNVPYSFKFITRSKYGPKSAGAIKTPATTFVGKTANPADVALVTPRSVNGIVEIEVQPGGVDTDRVAIELRRILEVDVGAKTLEQQWGSATYVDQKRATQFTDAAPYKPWRYLAKATDGIRYSTNAKAGTVTHVPAKGLQALSIAFKTESQLAGHGLFSRRGVGANSQAAVEHAGDGSTVVLLAREITWQEIQDQIDATFGTSGTIEQWAAANPYKLCFPLAYDTKRVVSVAVTAGGSGYPVASAIDAIFSAPQDAGGTRPRGFAVTNGSGVVTSFVLLGGGSGYTAAPTVTLGGSGSGATFAASLGTEQAAKGDIYNATLGAYVHGTSQRNYEYRFYGKTSERLGTPSLPIMTAEARAVRLMNNNEVHAGPTVFDGNQSCRDSPRDWGFRLSTNDRYAQEIVHNLGAASTPLVQYTKERKTVVVDAGKVTTDGSGNATVTFPVAMLTSTEPVVLFAEQAGAQIKARLTAAPTNTGFSIQTYNTSTGAAVGSVVVYYSAEDVGLGGSLTVVSS